MFLRVLKSVSSFLALVCFVSIAAAAGAQVVSAIKGAAGINAAPKWDFFAGYSYLSPHGYVETQLKNGPVPFSFVPIDGQAIGSITRFFNKHWGWELSGDIHLQNDYPYVGKYVPRNEFSGWSGGVIYRFRPAVTTPFVHLMMGAEIADGPHYQMDHWGPVGTVGGGMDCATPLFKHHMAIRLFQADYQYVHENWGNESPGGIGNADVLRLSAGAVFHGGSTESPAVLGLACLANKASIYPGEPVTVTATVSNLNPRHEAIYSWSGAGVAGNGATATVETISLAAGTYTVSVRAKESRPARDCLRVIQPQWADCSASFTVKPFEPPTVTCVASPATIKPGETSTVTAVGVSPQNRPLTYSYSATAGTVTGEGATAVFHSAGAPTGVVEIPCTVADDKGQTSTARTSVNILPPYVPPVQHTEALCSISYSKDQARPTRVDNEAKACLDEIALDLQKQPEAKVIVVGHSDAKEKARTAKEEKLAARNKHVKVQQTAAERAVNAKDYLVTEKGIDASRIAVATSEAEGQTAEDYLVPAGASFTADVQSTTPVDETAVKAQTRKPLPLRKHSHKRPAGE
jgi:outer membrane protein OmpA-like peptidoglycan-associated protein